MHTNAIECSGCGTAVEPLELFPRNRCLACHAKAYDQAIALGVMQAPTAEDITRMWGGK